MKKILFVTPGVGIGGTNSSLEALYSYIKDDFEIKVFAIAYHSTSRSYTFDNALLPFSRPLSLLYTNYATQRGFSRCIAFFYKAIQSLLRLLDIDLKTVVAKKVVKKIESNYLFDYVVAFQEGFATEFVSFFKSSNKIAWIHCDYDNWLPQGSELTLYENYLKIVCVSKYTASVFANRYPSLKNRILPIHNLLEISRINSLSEQNVGDERFSTDQFTILSAGRFCVVKRFREIPHVAFLLKQQGYTFKWYILGPDNKDSEMTDYNNNLEKYNVQDCVMWLGDKPNPYPYFKSVDLYVCTSESEACPMVFKEARYFGLPIVSTDFPSSFEFVKDGEGLVSPIEELSDAIIKILQQNRDIDKNSFIEGINHADTQEVNNILVSVYKLFE